MTFRSCVKVYGAPPVPEEINGARQGGARHGMARLGEARVFSRWVPEGLTDGKASRKSLSHQWVPLGY